jgi:phosphotransferase system enzyme I (PtsP)
MSGIAIGPVVLHGTRRTGIKLLADDPEAELKRLHEAAERMQRGLDALIAGVPTGGRSADASASREVLEAYRLVAADAGWLRRVGEVIRGGLTAEAAVQRIAGEMHDRMRRISDAYLRERLADMEDLANRLLTTLLGDEPRGPIPAGAILLARRLGPAELLDWHAAGIAGVAIEEASPSGHAAILARALDIPAVGATRGMLDTAEPGDEAVLDRVGVRVAVAGRLEAESLGLQGHRDRERTSIGERGNVLLQRPLHQHQRRPPNGQRLSR